MAGRWARHARALIAARRPRRLASPHRLGRRPRGDAAPAARILAIGAGLYIAAITLAELMPHHGGGGPSGATLNAAGLAAMAFAFALMRLFEAPGGALATRALQPDRPAEPKPV